MLQYASYVVLLVQCIFTQPTNILTVESFFPARVCPKLNTLTFLNAHSIEHDGVEAQAVDLATSFASKQVVGGDAVVVSNSSQNYKSRFV